MGCDGGTIPKRNELVKQKRKPEQRDKEAEVENRWRHCALSQEPLQEPIVMCAAGHLYNKTAVIEQLLDKTNNEHIKNLRDVRELKLTKNPEFLNGSAIEKQNSFIDKIACRFICPITRLEMNGKSRFVALWRCGCVFSEKAFKKLNDRCCPCCSKVYKAEEVIVLNGGAEDNVGRVSELSKRRKVAE